MRASSALGGRSLSQYSQFGRSCRAMTVSLGSISQGRIAGEGRNTKAGFPSISAKRIALFSPSPVLTGRRRGELSPHHDSRRDAPHPTLRVDLSPQRRAGRGNYLGTGSLVLSLSRSSTIEERTCATLGCGISTSLTRLDRLLR